MANEAADTDITTFLQDVFDIDPPAATAAASPPPPPPSPPPPATKPKLSESPESRIARWKKSKGKPVYLDLETIPDVARESLFDLPEIPAPKPVAEHSSLPSTADLLAKTLAEIGQVLAGINAPQQYLELLREVEQNSAKPRKGLLDLIVDQMAAKDKYQAALAARIKLQSVTPEYCRIIAIGLAVGDDPPVALVDGGTAAAAESEAEMLEVLWDLLAALHAGQDKASSQLVGFNIAGFDLRVIQVRSILLGVKGTYQFPDKPWADGICDLMLKRFGTLSNASGFGLKKLARLYGLEVSSDGDGSKVYEMWQAGQRDRISEYVRSDVAICQQLHRKFNGVFC